MAKLAKRKRYGWEKIAEYQRPANSDNEVTHQFIEQVADVFLLLGGTVDMNPKARRLMVRAEDALIAFFDEVKRQQPIPKQRRKR